MDKQTIHDFRKENWIAFGKIGCVIKMDEYREILTIKYPSGFVWELRGTDFPTRNLIPIVDHGKIVGYEQGHDAVPSPSLKRFLDSGEINYVPEELPLNSFTGNETVVKQGVF